MVNVVVSPIVPTMAVKPMLVSSLVLEERSAKKLLAIPARNRQETTA